MGEAKGRRRREGQAECVAEPWRGWQDFVVGQALVQIVFYLLPYALTPPRMGMRGRRRRQRRGSGRDIGGHVQRAHVGREDLGDRRAAPLSSIGRLGGPSFVLSLGGTRGSSWTADMVSCHGGRGSGAKELSRTARDPQ